MTEILTVDKVLHLRLFGNNQTKLAKFLDINRGTLRKYMDDLLGDRHRIIVIDDKYHLFVNVSDYKKGKL